MPPEPYRIAYAFLLANGDTECFDLAMDAATLELATPPPAMLPAWTALSFRQCPHCPLDLATEPCCPVATNLAPLVQRLDHLVSYDTVTLEVTTAERQVRQQTTAQRALGSLMGLLIAVSRCPHTHFFKPMARFHLPLATEEETAYRAAANFLLAHYFMNSGEKPADAVLTGLTTVYRNIQIINQAMADRLRAASESDSSVNAIVLLDMYAKGMSYLVNKDLEEIRQLFLPYLRLEGK